jgi:hypothetical protein
VSVVTCVFAPPPPPPKAWPRLGGGGGSVVEEHSSVAEPTSTSSMNMEARQNNRTVPDIKVTAGATSSSRSLPVKLVRCV